VVRLVVLIFVVISFLSACTSMPSSEQYDPRSVQSYEDTSKNNNELLRLDEGKHHPAIQFLLSQAEEARQHGDNRQALSYLDQARQIQPRNSAILYRLSWLNYQKGDLSQAQQLLQRAKLYLNSDKILQQRVTSLQNSIDAKLGF
jgi:tetratricopeptide (TPR) repeat protein